jgi:aminopeptidase N
MAAYDVIYYDLSIAVDPENRSIEGMMVIHLVVLDTLETVMVHLDPRLEVREVAVRGEREGEMASGGFEHRSDNTVRIPLYGSAVPGTRMEVHIRYGGQPRVAPAPPWDGGFTWATTPDGAPWIATSNQLEGCRLWWPCKDHPSDRADSVRIRVTVPSDLVAASNGRFRGMTDEGATRTWDWFVSTPINNYAVALNIAPYARVDTLYESVAGDIVPVSFWVLPGQTAAARGVLPEFLDHMRFLEETVGPYPFRADKYGIAFTPFLGMEHQTIIAYGNRFGRNDVLGYDLGFDALHFHELAHEWFANMVSAADWKDFWIHESFSTYLEALYAEHLHGEDGYHRLIDHFRGRVALRNPVALRESASTRELYGQDVYFRGAMVLHSLRFLMGDEAFLLSLRRMAYPDPALERVTDGSHTRLAHTGEYIEIVNELTGQDLGWFFDVYLYEREMPAIVETRSGNEVRLRWRVPGDLPFPMPIPVEVDGERRTIEFDGRNEVVVTGTDVRVDPQRRVFQR